MRALATVRFFATRLQFSSTRWSLLYIRPLFVRTMASTGDGASGTTDPTPVEASTAANAPNITTSPPTAGQSIRHGDKEYTTVREGLASILIPQAASATQQGKEKQKQKQKKSDEPAAVFYNPIQQFNRDLSVLAIAAYGEHVVKEKRRRTERNVERLAKRGMKRKREGDEGAEEKPEQQQESGKPADEMDIDRPEKQEQKPAPAIKQPQFSILDALAASGLRALRYAKEIPFVTRVVGNDLSASAVESMQLNIENNSVANKVRAHKGDALTYMYAVAGGLATEADGKPSSKFDVVDLDPYGTAAPFLDAAVHAANADGGLLCVTCTDAGVFASNGYPEKAYALYGGLPIKGLHSHEGGLRLILHALSTTAARYGLAIEPLLSLSIDFYARVFVRLHRSPAAVKFCAGKAMVVYGCDSGCGAWATQPLATNRPRTGKDGSLYYQYAYAQAPTAAPMCEHCGFKTHLAGPMWAGPLHNPHFIRRILDRLPTVEQSVYSTTQRIHGVLSTALEEDLSLAHEPEQTDSAPELSDAPKPTTDTNTINTTALIPPTDPAALEPHPFFFLPSYLCKIIHAQTIPEDALRGALARLGYASSRSHARPGSIRTDAPWAVLWEVLREWTRQCAPVREGAIRPGTPGAGIMRWARERRQQEQQGEQGGQGGQGRQGNGEVTGSKNVDVDALRNDVLAALDNSSGGDADFATLSTRLEAALYRASRRAETGTGAGLDGNGNENAKAKAQVPAEGTTNSANSEKQQQQQEKAAAAVAHEKPAQQSTSENPPNIPDNNTHNRARNGRSRSRSNPRSRSRSPRDTPDPATLNVVFDDRLGRALMAGKGRVTRYQVNPCANWGPMSRAGTG